MLKTFERVLSHGNNVDGVVTNCVMLELPNEAGELNYCWIMFPSDYDDHYRFHPREVDQGAPGLRTNDFGTAMDAAAEYLEHMEAKLLLGSATSELDAQGDQT